VKKLVEIFYFISFHIFSLQQNHNIEVQYVIKPFVVFIYILVKFFHIAFFPLSL